MDKELKNSNKIPGSCEEFTRPEEISELSKYLKDLKLSYEERTVLEKKALGISHNEALLNNITRLDNRIDILDPSGKKVSKLVNNDQWETTKKEIELLSRVKERLSPSTSKKEASEEYLTVPKLKSKEEILNNLKKELLSNVGNTNIQTNLPDTRDTLVVDSNVKLNNRVDRLTDSKKNIKLSKSLNKISDKSKASLSNKLSKITSTKDPKLSTKLSELHINKLDSLSEKRDNLVTEDIKDLELTRQDISVTNIRDLSNKRDNIDTTSINKLDEHLDKLIDHSSLDLTRKSVKLSDVKKSINLSEQLDKIKDTTEIELENKSESIVGISPSISLSDNTDKLKVTQETILSKNLDKLDVKDSTNLSNKKDKLRVESDVKLSKKLDELSINNITGLPDNTDKLRVTQETILSKNLDKLNVKDSINLSNKKDKLQVEDDINLSNSIDSVTGIKSIKELTPSRENLHVLGDDTKLSDSREGLILDSETELSTSVSKLNVIESKKPNLNSDNLFKIRGTKEIEGFDVINRYKLTDKEITELSDSLLTIEGDKEITELSNHKESILGKEIDSLDNTRLDIEDDTLEELSDHLDNINDTREVELSTKLEELDAKTENKLSDKVINLEDNSKINSLSEFVDNIDNNIEIESLSSKLEKLDGSEEDITGLSDVLEKITGDNESVNSLSNYRDNINDAQEINKLSDIIDKISDSNNINSLSSFRNNISNTTIVEELSTYLSKNEIPITEIALSELLKSVENNAELDLEKFTNEDLITLLINKEVKLPDSIETLRSDLLKLSSSEIEKLNTSLDKIPGSGKEIKLENELSGKNLIKDNIEETLDNSLISLDTSSKDKLVNEVLGKIIIKNLPNNNLTDTESLSDKRLDLEDNTDVSSKLGLKVNNINPVYNSNNLNTILENIKKRVEFNKKNQSDLKKIPENNASDIDSLSDKRLDLEDNTDVSSKLGLKVNNISSVYNSESLDTILENIGKRTEFYKRNQLDLKKIPKDSDNSEWTEDEGLYENVLGVNSANGDDYKEGWTEETGLSNAKEKFELADQDIIDSRVKSRIDKTNNPPKTIDPKLRILKPFDNSLEGITDRIEEKAKELNNRKVPNLEENDLIKKIGTEDLENLRQALISRDKDRIDDYFKHIAFFSESKFINKGWSNKLMGYVSSYLSGTNITKVKFEEFLRLVYKEVLDDYEYGNNKFLSGANPRKDITTLNYNYCQIPKYRIDFSKIKNPVDISSYIRWMAEKTTNILPSKSLKTWRKFLLDTTLWALCEARRYTEVALKSNKERLPGGDLGLISKLAGGGFGGKDLVDAGTDLAKDITKGAILAGSNLLDTSKPMNRPSNKRLLKKFESEEKEGTAFEEGNMRPSLSPDTDGNVEYKPSDAKWGKKFKKSLFGGSSEKTYKFDERYLRGLGIKTTLAELAGTDVYSINSIYDLRQKIRDSQYMNCPERYTTTSNKYNVYTLDSNDHWEIIFEPYVGYLNGNKSFLPSFEEINLDNLIKHNIRTTYSRWIPFTGFELSKSRMMSKSIGLTGGEFSIPYGIEYTNELRLTISDDMFKSWRLYFEKCMNVSIYNSNSHLANFYGQKENEVGEQVDRKGTVKFTGLLGVSELIQKVDPEYEPTIVDKNYMLPAFFKNITFRCIIYNLTPQLSTVSRYDLLVVLREMAEERSGEIESGGTDLNLSFSIVGENPTAAPKAPIKFEKLPDPFEKKKPEEKFMVKAAKRIDLI